MRYTQVTENQAPINQGLPENQRSGPTKNQQMDKQHASYGSSQAIARVRRSSVGSASTSSSVSSVSPMSSISNQLSANSSDATSGKLCF